MGDREFWFWDWFVLGTCTFRKGGVMIRWLGPLGRRVGASNHATKLFCIEYGCVLGLYSDTLHFEV